MVEWDENGYLFTQHVWHQPVRTTLGYFLVVVGGCPACPPPPWKCPWQDMWIWGRGAHQNENVQCVAAAQDDVTHAVLKRTIFIPLYHFRVCCVIQSQMTWLYFMCDAQPSLSFNLGCKGLARDMYWYILDTLKYEYFSFNTFLLIPTPFDICSKK